MNRVFVGMILAVCVLGMILGLLNERLAQKPESGPAFSQNIQPRNQITAKVDNDLASTPIEAPETGKILAEENQLAREELTPPPARVELPDASAPAEQLENAAKVQLEDEASSQDQPLQAPINAQVTPAQEPIPQAPVQEQRPAIQTESKPAATQLAAKPAIQVKPGTITRFVVFAREHGATVRLTGSSPMHYKSMTLENPHRVVIDLDGDWSFPANLAVPKNELVNSVRVGKIDGKTRVVVDLKEKPRTARVLAAKTGDGLDLRVDK